MKNAADAGITMTGTIRSAGSSTGESMDNSAIAGGAEEFRDCIDDAVSRNMADASTPKQGTDRTMSVQSDSNASALENGLEWRDKVEDRSARQHIARIMCVFRIVCLVFVSPTAFCDFGLCFSTIL